MLKLSGEVLSGGKEGLVDLRRVRSIAEEVAELKGEGAIFA
ncbi:MAG: UMP kinase, partial [Deltaproteobacteria bacterium]